ncbi:hypothetical protein FHG66_02090 [Rubellimicrobium rubrum]|uniref:Uncharacterized protein n=1 Tax=Rubellimicrobium rubrum TaxID=2585369 RepID=A0A5C4N5X2_9RHOB|nr:hypothetical protein [Rubellimicrobium rubrum]TNC52354.1 hypothetical protein FHG66_02090 [Rubellimicrobium rubrum]
MMTTLFRRRYTVTLYTSEAGLDLRDEIGEVLMDIENDSIVRGTVENQGDETEVSDEESERELDAAEVGFTSLSEEEYAELQRDDD